MKNKSQKALTVLLIIFNLLVFSLVYHLQKGNIIITFDNNERNTIDNEITTAAIGILIANEIDCNEISRDELMVALVFGQSNAANFGESAFKASDNVYNFYGGKCFIAQDPLLGADGDGGSVWVRLGGRLVSNGAYNNVMLIALGVGGSGVVDWSDGGELHENLIKSILEVEQSGFVITHFLWMQGEEDSKIRRDGRRYMDLFDSMFKSIRRVSNRSKIYIAISTYRHGKIDDEIQAAQRELVNPDRGIYLGPNTDLLDNSYRYDGTHYNSKGLDRVADLWYEALTVNNEQ